MVILWDPQIVYKHVPSSVLAQQFVLILVKIFITLHYKFLDLCVVYFLSLHLLILTMYLLLLITFSFFTLISNLSPSPFQTLKCVPSTATLTSKLLSPSSVIQQLPPYVILSLSIFFFPTLQTWRSFQNGNQINSHALAPSQPLLA